MVSCFLGKPITLAGMFLVWSL